MGNNDKRSSKMRTIPARKTSLSEIDNTTAFEFISEHHRSGMAKPGTNIQNFGLYFNNELLAVAVFCNPRTKRKQQEYTTELFRLAFKDNVRIQGGGSKLIKHFMNQPKSIDLFTYQDTSGESTNVYKHSGMTLIGEKNPTKKIAVLDGLTFKTVTNNRKDWFSIEQIVKFGPDALIGTHLGEVFENGKRVSNLDLFLRNGYHLEEIPGDRIYEWHNPKFKFYTYKITSKTDDNYYYGRHRTTLNSIDEMLSDGYMGSGGVKYQNWIKSIDEENLQKDILSIYDTWAESVKEEKKLIGDKYKTDSNCKNSKPGGVGLSSYFPEHIKKFCSIHGESLHLGNTCKKCSVQKTFKENNCPVHGKTIFQKDHCVKCYIKGSVETKICPIHGKSKHRGEVCSKCIAANLYTLKNCTVHGETLHMGDVCKTCISQKSISIKICSKHGETKHIGELCRKCINESHLKLKDCSIHGLVLHQSDSCTHCASEKRVDFNNCPKHGKTKFLGTKCAKCIAEKGVNTQVCSVHGETKFVGKHCKKCMAAKVWSVQKCSVHGESKHRSNKCVKCAIQERKTNK